MLHQRQNHNVSHLGDEKVFWFQLIVLHFNAVIQFSVVSLWVSHLAAMDTTAMVMAIHMEAMVGMVTGITITTDIIIIMVADTLDDNFTEQNNNGQMNCAIKLVLSKKNQ